MRWSLAGRKARLTAGGLIALLAGWAGNAGEAVQAKQAIAAEFCQPIDFESVPGGVPREGLSIDNQFVRSDGMAFVLEDGTAPRLAAVGGSATAVIGPSAVKRNDRPAPDQGIGRFFLTDAGTLNRAVPSPLNIWYSRPAAHVSGVLIDVDADERFTIEAVDENGTLLSTLTLAAGEPHTGDGLATPWSVSRATADIAAIRIIGTGGGRVSVGFDRFCAAGHRDPP